MKRFSALMAIISFVLAMPGENHAKKNLVFLLADDMRWDTYGAMGNTVVKTPILDSLAKEGVIFSRAYIPGSNSAAVCAPSRAMMFTGRPIWNTHRHIPASDTTWPEQLRKSGYYTFSTGKHHNLEAVFMRQFDEGEAVFFGGMSNQYRAPVCEWNAATMTKPTAKHDHYIPGTKTPSKDIHSSTAYATAAINFLSNYEKNSPWAIYVSFRVPHDPRDAPKEYHDMYPPENITLEENYSANHDFYNSTSTLNNVLTIRDERLRPYPRKPEHVKKDLGDYYATITHMDYEIGRILDEVKKRGEVDSTIVIFTGDNGIAIGRHGLYGKQNNYEHAVHVPLIMAGPGIPKDKKTDLAVYLYDLFPTFFDLMGERIPSTVQGKSFARLFSHNDTTEIRPTMKFFYTKYNRSYIDGRYKIIEYFMNKKRFTELFDLEADGVEKNNLSDSAAYEEVLAWMRHQLVVAFVEDKTHTDNESFWSDYKKSHYNTSLGRPADMDYKTPLSFSVADGSPVHRPAAANAPAYRSVRINRTRSSTEGVITFDPAVGEGASFRLLTVRGNQVPANFTSNGRTLRFSTTRLTPGHYLIAADDGGRLNTVRFSVIE